MSTNEVSTEILERFKKVSSATLYSAVGIRFGIKCFMEGVNPMTPGVRMAARARTLRCVPPRPDLHKEVVIGENSPEYRAMALCGPGDVLVVECMRFPYGASLGDVKLLHLQMQRADGLVTDGAIRDLDVVRTYGFSIFAQKRTPSASEYTLPYEENVPIQCAGVLVRPGDVIVGDDDGVVVIPLSMAEEVIAWTEEHEAAEEYVKEKILAESCRPGRHYPPTEATIEERYRVQGKR